MGAAVEVHQRVQRLSHACPPGSTKLHVLVAVFMLAIANGFQVYSDSVVDNLLAPAGPYLLRTYGSKKAGDEAWEWLVSGRTWGMALGSLISMILALRMSRNHQLQTSLWCIVIGLSMCFLIDILPFGLWPAIVGRFICGIGQAVAATAGTVMIAEVVPRRWSGMAQAVQIIAACLGELTGMVISIDALMGNETYWIYAMVVPVLPAIPALVALHYTPTSPRELMMAKREEEARKALLYYQSPADMRATLIAWEEEDALFPPDVDTSFYSSLKRMRGRFADGQFMRQLATSSFLLAGVHLDDWLWISYSTPVFESLGAPSSVAQLSSLCMIIPGVIVSFVMLIYFDCFERRTLLLLPTLLSAVCGILVWLVSTHNVLQWHLPVHYTVAGIASVDLIMAAIAGESAYATLPDLFHERDRALGIAFVTFVQNVFGAGLSLYLLTGLNSYGAANIGVLFALGNLSYAIVMHRVLPETGNKSSAEIARGFSSDMPGLRVVKKLWHASTRIWRRALSRLL